MVRLIKVTLNYLPAVIVLLVIGWLSSCTSRTTTKLNPRPVDYPTYQAVEYREENPLAITATTAPTPALVNTPTPTEAMLMATEHVRGAQHEPAPTDLVPFTPEMMKPGVAPIPYITNPCAYLENRWAEGKSNPGTVVVPIMFHSVVRPGRLITDDTSISMEYFEYFMDKAKNLGFSTITTEQLVGFLEENQAIPERSMMLILDDRRPGVTALFMPYLQENDWTLTLGWIATHTTRNYVWELMYELAETGRLDVQSHGYDHLYLQDYITEAQIDDELYKSMAAIEIQFGTKPMAYVWPGGNYNAYAIDVAGKAGYQIGFTVHSRGPIMFNWIPLGEPEIAMNAPLMLLPRFWSTAAVQALEEAVMVNEAAKAYAHAEKAAELDYYHYYCRPLLSE